MKTIFRYTLSRFYGQILGWGLALFLLGVMSVARYDIMRENQEPIKEILKGSAGRLIGMFGDPTKLMSPEGFLSLAFFSYLPLILGVFAVLAGSGLLAADEENGTLDLILAHPVSRTALFLGRLLAFVVATLAILGLKGEWFGGLLAVAGLFTAVAWWCFQRRDIRVVGEGVWRWPWWRQAERQGERGQ